MIINDSNTTAANSQETTATLLTTKEAAELLGVSVDALRKWRQRRLFGCPFFTADTFYGNTAYYDRERVEQLKAIYQPGVLQDMYKLARLNSEDNPPYYFQNSGTWLRNAGNLRKLLKEYKSPRGHNGFYSLAQVAEIFNVTERTVQQWVDSKELQWSRYDHANKLLFDRGNLEALVARRSEESPESYSGGKSMDNQAMENFSARIAEAENFFSLLFGNVKDKHFSYLWTKQDKKTYPFDVSSVEERKKTAELAIKLNDAGCDVYFGVNLGDEPMPSTKRYTKEQVTIQTATITDIDVFGGEHTAADKYPPSIDAAASFLPFDVSLLADSGYGVHGYCIYDEPIKITADNRESCIERNKNFINTVRSRAGRYSKAVDGVHDLPRILRMPGTRNYKLGVSDDAPLCHVIKVNDVRFTPADMDQRLAALKPSEENLFDDKKSARQAEKSRAKTFEQAAPSDDAAYDEYRARIMLDCINPADLTDTEWLAVQSACKNLCMSYSLVDEWNSRDPERYHAEENQRRWDSLNDSSYDIETLHGIAKRFGYGEKDARREWYQLHPELSTREKPHKPKDIPIDLLLSEEQKQKLFGTTARDDLSNGIRLADLWSRELRYLKDVDKWMTYSGGLWTVGTDSRTSAIMSQISRTAKILAANAVSDDEKKVAACFTQSRKISGAILFLKGVDDVIVTEKDLDTHSYLLNCRDCVVDLQTGKRLEADPKLLLTRQAGATFRGMDYRDPDNHVEKFLQSIMPNDETRRALLRFLGYALTGVIREHVAQLWRGDGRNGKSTLIKFLFLVLGTYAVKLPMTALLDSGRPADPNQATTALNALEGARLAICDELMRRARLNTALFKTLTGGDEITIRHLHAEFKTIQASAKIIFNGNYLPEIDDPTDLGLRERLRNVPFNQTFIGDRADPNLQEKLSTSEALSALLAILVAESVTWYKDGLLESAEMKEAKREYISSNDFISEFIDEHCNRGINLSIPRKTLLAALKEHYPGECARIFGNNDRALTDAIKRLEGISYRRGGQDGGNKFFGIGLKYEPEQQSFDEFSGEPIAADTAVPAFDENDLPLDD